MCRARLDWLGSRLPTYGPVGFLPDDDGSLIGVRAWLGWQELWRSDDALEQTFRDERDTELAILAECLGHRLDRDEMRHLLALVDGLYVALSAPVDPLRPRTAMALLARHLRQLGVVDPDWLLAC